MRLPEVEISVMRLGTMEGRVSCKFVTRDGSAEAGVRSSRSGCRFEAYAFLLHALKMFQGSSV